MLELIHTSAPRGLIQGRSGYTPVAWTDGFPVNLLPTIENFSAYNFVAASPEKAAATPELYFYRKIRFGVNELRVVSRIAFSGLDYSGRVNKIAHHLIFTDADELAQLGGAAKVALATENFQFEFHGEPRLLPPRLARAAEPSCGGAECWRRFAGDPGWSVAVGRAFRDAPERPFFVEFDDTCKAPSLLELAAGVEELLPPTRIDDFTFCTYCPQNETGSGIFLRCVPVNTQAASAARRMSRDRLVSLVTHTPAPQLPPEPELELELELELEPRPTVETSPETAPETPTPPVKPATSAKRLRWLLAGLVIIGVAGVAIRAMRKPDSKEITVVSAAPERPLIPAPPPPLPPKKALTAHPAAEIAPQVIAVAVGKSGFASEKLAAEESFSIWRDWKNGKDRIALPSVLAPALRLKLEFTPDSKYAAFPQDAGENYVIVDGGTPLKRLELRLDGDTLKLDEPEAADAPRRSDLAAVLFIDRDGKAIRFETDFQDGVELATKNPGTVTPEARKGAMVWVYRPSEIVLELADRVVVSVNGVRLKNINPNSKAIAVVRLLTAPFDRYAEALKNYRVAMGITAACRKKMNSALEPASAACKKLTSMLTQKRYSAMLEKLKLPADAPNGLFAVQDKALKELQIKLGNDGRIDSTSKQPMLKELAIYAEALEKLRGGEKELTNLLAAEKTAYNKLNDATAALLKALSALPPKFEQSLAEHLTGGKELPPVEECIKEWCPPLAVTVKPAEETARP